MAVDKDNYQEVLHSSRVHIVPEIKISVTCSPSDILSSDLITSLFTKMANSSVMNLKSLNLRLMKHSDDPPELFGVALVRMINEDQVLNLLFAKITN